MSTFVCPKCTTHSNIFPPHSGGARAMCDEMGRFSGCSLLHSKSKGVFEIPYCNTMKRVHLFIFWKLVVIGSRTRKSVLVSGVWYGPEFCYPHCDTVSQKHPQSSVFLHIDSLISVYSHLIIQIRLQYYIICCAAVCISIYDLYVSRVCVIHHQTCERSDSKVRSEIYLPQTQFINGCVLIVLYA